MKFLKSSLVIFLILAPLKIGFAINRELLTGAWYHDGQPVSIQRQFDRIYIFCNEQHKCSNGYINPRGIITVPEWQVTGRIQSDGSAISWSNQTIWSRQYYYPPTYPSNNQNFYNPYLVSGPWVHNGRPTFIQVYGNNQLSITNEVNQTYQGYLADNRTIIIPSQQLEGTINYRGNKIYWNNHTTWER